MPINKINLLYIHSLRLMYEGTFCLLEFIQRRTRKHAEKKEFNINIWNI